MIDEILLVAMKKSNLFSMNRNIKTIIYLACFTGACCQFHRRMKERWQATRRRMYNGTSPIIADIVSSIIRMSELIRRSSRNGT